MKRQKDCSPRVLQVCEPKVIVQGESKCLEFTACLPFGASLHYDGDCMYYTKGNIRDGVYNTIEVRDGCIVNATNTTNTIATYTPQCQPTPPTFEKPTIPVDTIIQNPTIDIGQGGGTGTVIAQEQLKSSTNATGTTVITHDKVLGKQVQHLGLTINEYGHITFVDPNGGGGGGGLNPDDIFRPPQITQGEYITLEINNIAGAPVYKIGLDIDKVAEAVCAICGNTGGGGGGNGCYELDQKDFDMFDVPEGATVIIEGWSEVGPDGEPLYFGGSHSIIGLKEFNGQDRYYDGHLEFLSPIQLQSPAYTIPGGEGMDQSVPATYQRQVKATVKNVGAGAYYIWGKAIPDLNKRPYISKVTICP